jgi:hypothetical protein
MKRWRYTFPLELETHTAGAQGEELVASIRAMLEKKGAENPYSRVHVGIAMASGRPQLYVWLDYPEADWPAPEDLAIEIAAEIMNRGLRPASGRAFSLSPETSINDVTVEVPTGELRLESAPLRLWMDPGDAPPELVADLLRALSDLHVAYGGSGLRYSIDEDGSLMITPAEELV